jgi:opacity protein-like surface antigen
MQSILSFTPYDVRVSAWYGQGGVRLTTGSASAVQPYVETLAGLSRLHAGVAGLGAADPYVNAALGFLTTTRPLASLGGGVVFQSGAVMLDAGYRFSRIFAANSVAGTLTGGDIDGNQVRVGLGVRF